jgi:hypothetical protein
MGKLGIIFDALSYVFSPKELNQGEQEWLDQREQNAEAHQQGFDQGYNQGVNDVLHADQHIPEPVAVTALDEALSSNPAIEAMDESLAD